MPKLAPVSPREFIQRLELQIYWDDQDEIFVAEAPELPGCAAHGESRAETMLNAGVAIANWVRAAKDIGQPIPKPGKRSLVA
jgi:predicted RNase H-like HicB family nuclease